jgi:anti-sigma regulatory factor (Ser/Thr protein kinase)
VSVVAEDTCTTTAPAQVGADFAQAVAGGQLAVGKVGPTWRALRLDPNSVRYSRRMVAGVLADANVTDTDHIDDVTLTVSELVTNALRVSAELRSWEPYETPVHLGIATRPRWTHVYVTDPDRTMPVQPAGPPDELAEKGRGLGIVDHLAAVAWIAQGDHGKTVHAVIARAGMKLTAAERDELVRRLLI